MPESGALSRLARSDLLRFGAVVFLAQSANNVLNFVYHVLVSRRLGVVAYGELTALLALFTILSAPAAILTTVVVRYAAEFQALGEPAKLRALALRVGQRLGVVALAIVPAGMLLAGPTARWLNVSSAQAVWLAGALLAVNLVLPAVRGVLQGAEAYGAYALSTVLDPAVKVPLALAFTAMGWSVGGALGAWVVGSAVALLFTLGVLGARYAREPRVPLEIDLQRLWRTSAGVTGATVLIMAMGFGDVVLVKHFFDPRSAGLYGAAALVGKMLFWLVSFVPAVLLPRAAVLATRGESTTRVLWQALGAVALFAGGGLAFYAVAPGLVVTMLTGSAFAAAAPLVFPYGVATILLAALNVVAQYRFALHRFGFVIPLALIALGEAAAIVRRHATPADVIGVLIVGNALGLLVALYRASGRRARLAAR